MINTAYYSALAGAGGLFFGVGAGILATRVVSLLERAAILDRERGDFINRQVTDDPGLEAAWGERARRNDLADLHLAAKSLRTAVVTPLLFAAVVIGVSLTVLAGWIPDRTSVRASLLAAFFVGAAVWVRVIARLAHKLVSFTSTSYEQRQSERKDGTAKGLPPLVSGDLAHGIDRLGELVGEPTGRVFTRWRKRRSLTRAQRVMRRQLAEAEERRGL